MKIIEAVAQLKKLKWPELIAYFPNLSRNSKAAKRYTLIRLGGYQVFKSRVREEMRFFFETYKGNTYPKPLENSDNPKELDILTLTSPSLDIEPINLIINKALKEKVLLSKWYVN